jgi:hypothetical protein
MGAGIPLPALHVEAPQQPDTLGNFQKLLAIKQQQAMAPLQQQEAKQNIQSGAIEVQAKQQQLKDQQAMTAAMQGWDGKDYDSLVQGAIKNGASANTVMQIRKTSMEAQKGYSEIVKNNAAAGADQISTMMKKNDVVAGAISSVLAQPDEALPNSLMQTASQLAQQGLLDPQHVQQAQQIAQSGNPAAIRQQLEFFKKGYMADSAQMKAALDTAQTAKDTAQAGEATAQTNKLNTEAQFGPTGPAAEAKYRFILSKMAAGAKLSPEEQNFAKGFEASNAKTTATSDSLGVTSTNTSRPAGVATLQRSSNAPAAAGAPPVKGSAQNTRESVVDLIGQYKYDPAQISRLMVKHPEIMAQVAQKYPDFDQSTYNAKNKLIQSYTSGPHSREINAINTAMGHIKNLDDAIDAMNNGNTTLLNKIGTAYNINVGGKTPEAAFKLIVNRVGPEISSAYIPGGGGEGERISNKEDFNVNLPPQTLHNNAAITVNMLRSKIGSLENQYKNTVGRDDFNQRFITPEARASLQKMSPQGGGAQHAPGAKAGLQEGATGTGSDGKKYVVKGGVWVAQ